MLLILLSIILLFVNINIKRNGQKLYSPITDCTALW
jgi:hypothetical protein